MDPVQRQASSGNSGGDSRVDERKRKRMESNRESARRSRMRKQEHLDELIGQVSKLQIENVKIGQKIDTTMKLYSEVESENNILRAQVQELTDRLKSLNEILSMAEEVNCVTLDVSDMLDTFMEPWQFAYPPAPVMAPTNVYYC